MSRTLPWQLWPGRHYPLTLAEERDFVAELRVIAMAERTAGVTYDAVKTTQRDIITVLVGALRCGVGFRQMFALAPGLRAHVLLEAYEHIERLRRGAHLAWTAIENDPSLTSITENSQTASTLMPIPVRDLVTRARTNTPTGLARAVAKTTARVAEVTAQAQAVELDLVRGSLGSEALVERGRVLYDPYTPGLWSNSYFLPDRVGALTPVRLSDLLGERSRP